jgi:hypothetical protein
MKLNTPHLSQPLRELQSHRRWAARCASCLRFRALMIQRVDDAHRRVCRNRVIRNRFFRRRVHGHYLAHDKRVIGYMHAKGVLTCWE